MSEDKQRSNHTTAWVVTLIALPVLYVLSWGPMMGLGYNRTIPKTADTWLEKFYQPVWWLYYNTPLKKPLDAYVCWWINVLWKPVSPAVPK